MPRAAHERIPKKRTFVAYTQTTKKQRKTRHPRADRAQHSCPSAFLDFSAPRTGRLLYSFTRSESPALNGGFAASSRCGLRMSALPAVSRFPAVFIKAPLRRNTLVRLSRLLLETHQAAFALWAAHTLRYTSMRRYWRRSQTRRRAAATNLTTGGGERQQTSAASVGILCIIVKCLGRHAADAISVAFRFLMFLSVRLCLSAFFLHPI